MFGGGLQSTGSGVYRPYPQTELHQRLPNLPVGDTPGLMPGAGVWCLALFAAAYPQVQLHQRLPIVRAPAVAVAVPFPAAAALYAAHQAAYPPDYPTVQLAAVVNRLIPMGARLLPVGADPVGPGLSFGLVMDGADYPFVQLLQRVRQLAPPPVIPPIAFPTPAAVYTQLVAAFPPDYPIVQLVGFRLRLLRVGDPPIAFPELGGWPPGTMDAPAPPAIWAGFRVRLIPVGDPAVPFPALGRWLPGIMDPPSMAVQAAQRLLAVAFAPTGPVLVFRLRDASRPDAILRDRSRPDAGLTDEGHPDATLQDRSEP